MKKSIYLIILSVFSLTLISNLGIAQESYNPEKTFKFLEDIFSRHDKKLHNILIDELEHYLKLFPENGHAPQVQHMLGKVYEEKGQKHLAVASYLKMVVLYPDFSKNAENTAAVKKLVSSEKDYKKKRDWLLGLLIPVVADRSAADRYHNYLNIMIELDHDKLREWTIESCREFTTRFPEDERNDDILDWTADTYSAKGNHKEADISYQKFSMVYPESPQLLDVLYKRGLLNYEKLLLPESAIKILNRIVDEYPDESQAIDALFLRAEIKERIKKYSQAVTDFRKLVNDYPESSKAVDALWKIGKINQDKIKDNSVTIAVYNEIVENYTSNPKGIEALEEIAKIYRNSGKYKQAAKTYARIADIYPDYPKAPELLLDGGVLCEKNKDYEKAIFYYEMYLDKFPEHKNTDNAFKRIKKAKEKIKKGKY